MGWDGEAQAERAARSTRDCNFHSPPPVPTCDAYFRDCEHSVSMIRSVCPYLSLEPAVLLSIVCVHFFVFVETLPTVCGTSLFLRKCISCA